MTGTTRVAGAMPAIDTICWSDLSAARTASEHVPKIARDTSLVRALAAVVVELQDCGGTTSADAAEMLYAESGEVAKGYHLSDIEALADVILASELPTLSIRYTALFREFNRRYFFAALPKYEVHVVFDVHTFADDPMDGPVVCSGLIRSEERRIYVRVTELEPMERILIHEMAHAATNDDHGIEWLSEMRRLKEAGAPVADGELE